MISVKPDPAHPRGGHAELSVPEDKLLGETAQVAVFDNYSERFLGESGWQPVKVMFGPYAVRREGGQAHLVIGPEIVNQIEEYANVKLMVGDAEQDVSWPDDVVPAPGAAKIGGIMGTKAAEVTAASALSAKMPEPEPEPAEVEPIPEPTPAPTVEPVETPAPKGKGGLIAGLVVVLLLAAALAYWLLATEDTPVTPVAEPVIAPAPVAEASDPCAADALRALEGFAAQSAALRGCAGTASADTALGLVERAAAAGDADALVLFGTVYDGEAMDAVIEDQIGLTFGDEPATAAEYYARAVAAGSTEASEKLAALCTRMADMTDTLVQGAVTDYCGN